MSDFNIASIKSKFQYFIKYKNVNTLIKFAFKEVYTFNDKTKSFYST